MRKPSVVAAAAVLCAAPLAWLLYFSMAYRCDLGHYAQLWGTGGSPSWLTAWEIAVTCAAALLALIVAPKIWRLWRRGQALTRGEWLVLAITPLVLILLARLAPAAMADPELQIAAFLGRSVDQCRH